MKERLKELMDKHQLTPLAMANKMGIQRSSISHLLSGRNKPSYDFIQKFLDAYPFVDAHWFITGKHKHANTSQKQQSLFDSVGEKHSEVSVHKNDIPNQIPASNQIKDSQGDKKIEPEVSSNRPTQAKEEDKTNEARLERIVWFYDDGSFKEYKPA
ncbi:MAG TPA: helix-turn-helix transcriptional regulator [Bacteroidales bacterium]|nr:helix-turn-helix transcriptional regulator [Bacteroidales bacterium]